MEFYLNSTKTRNEVVDAVDKINYAGGNTNTSGGLYRMRTEVFVPANGARPNVPKIAIVITDGVSTSDADKTIPYANEAKRDGIRIISVGITDQINEAELEAIASPPIGNSPNVFTADDFNTLSSILDNLLIVTCLTPTTPATTTPALRPVGGRWISLLIDPPPLFFGGGGRNTSDNLFTTWIVIL